MRQFYVDTENVQDAWIDVYKKMDKSDYIFLYTSKNVKPMSYETIMWLLEDPKHKHLEIREGIVSGSGDSSLDYFLLGEMNNRLLREKDLECIIVSNDKGYDKHILELRKKGFRVSRRAVDMKTKEMLETDAALEGTGREGKVIRIQEELMKIATENNQSNFPLASYDFTKMAQLCVSSKCCWMNVFGCVRDPLERHRIASIIPRSQRQRINSMV